MPAERGLTVDLLARHPELIDAVGEMRWREWGYGDPSPAAHIEITRREAGKENDLETRLAAFGRGTPALDAVEVDLETAGGAPTPSGRRARVALRSAHRRIVRVSDAEPTLADALDQAMSRAAHARDAFAAAPAAPGRVPQER